MAGTLAGTPMPHLFEGTLAVNGIPARVGTEVRAVDGAGNDITYNPPFTIKKEGIYGEHPFDWFGVYEPPVGSTIHFLAELSPSSGVFAHADQTYEFVSGGTTMLNLTATGEVPQGQASIVSVDSPQEAQPGDGVSVSAGIRNDGGEDTIFATLRDNDTTEVVGARTPLVMESGSQYTFTWVSTMPNRRWNLLLEAGHEE